MSSCEAMKTSGMWTPWGLEEAQLGGIYLGLDLRSRAMDLAIRRQAAELLRHYHYGGRMRRRGARAETSGPGPILQRPRRSLPAPYTPSIHSYHNFLRLRNLFPELNPRALHHVLELCSGDLVRTIDNIIYTKQINHVYFKKMVVYDNNNASFEPMGSPFPVQYQGSVPSMGPYPNQYSPYAQPSTGPLPSFEVLRNSIFGRGRPIPGQQPPSFPAMAGLNLQNAAQEHSSQHLNFAAMPEVNLPHAVPEHTSQNAWPLLGQQQTGFSAISEPNLPSVHLEHMSKVVSGSEVLNAPVSSHMEVLQKEDGLRRSNRRRQLSRRYQESYEQQELTDEMEPEFLQLVQPKVKSMPTLDLNLQLAMEDPEMRKLNKISLSKLDFNGKEDKHGVHVIQMIAKQKQNSEDSDKYSSQLTPVSCDSEIEVEEIEKPSIHPAKIMCEPKLECSETDKEIVKIFELQCKPEGQDFNDINKHCARIANGNCEPEMSLNNLKKHSKTELSNIHWESQMEYQDPIKQNTQPTNVNCELQMGISDLEKHNTHLIKMQDVTDLSWAYIDSNQMDCCLVMNTNPESTMPVAEVNTETSLFSEHHST